jgi:hypothetical protein
VDALARVNSIIRAWPSTTSYDVVVSQVWLENRKLTASAASKTSTDDFVVAGVIDDYYVAHLTVDAVAVCLRACRWIECVNLFARCTLCVIDRFAVVQLEEGFSLAAGGHWVLISTWCGMTDMHALRCL